jgi:hypothetical protein
MLKNRKPSPITAKHNNPPQTNEKPPTQTKKQETKTRNKKQRQKIYFFFDITASQLYQNQTTPKKWRSRWDSNP